MKTYSHLEQKMVKEFAEILEGMKNTESEDVWTTSEIEKWLRTSLRSMAEAAWEAIKVEKVLLHIDEKRGDNIGVEENWGNGYNEALADQDQKRREFFV